MACPLKFEDSEYEVGNESNIYICRGKPHGHPAFICSAAKAELCRDLTSKANEIIQLL